ncbi:MAG: hypothetical protein ACK54E_09000 [Pseudanabaena sp.]|jgi:hypothetical protein|nr:DUF2281 domain-containing protein [Pseudanabaena sp. M090S1SP2A07QC]MCA6506239.1 DUF2281 domain-containing protein [Pseudanabaena sp. M172S2SP2A07QC]MCA6524089.1 DUF2281 domain-containing protein [Pseudanabaena sp. M051S1SP2A07QC]MCA6526725.1 DUF2281 domain-containing protein [Pseudanabaena sp. M179S2SP2A07QC]MCA6532131.1 DUF2281 domain-containing protein [Pseudanabaena sp. M125S2SP2A07QC]MCA6534618.1 DUF2281 domain-containing protein [Pseudanabaena sp. M176S2SP2A07QC]MCA6537344.1 DUF2281 
MTIEQVVLENIRDLPTEKQQQVLDFVTFLKQQTTINLQSSSQGSRKSYKGMWADLGINITDEDITAARQEMWGNFPREFPS